MQKLSPLPTARAYHRRDMRRAFDDIVMGTIALSCGIITCGLLVFILTCFIEGAR